MRLIFLGLMFIASSDKIFLSDSSLRCVRIMQLSPIFDRYNVGKIVEYDNTTIDYYFIDSLRIYRISYMYQKFNGNILISRERRYQYFVHHVDSIYGRIFDTSLQKYNIRGHIDSVTMIHSFVDLQLEVLFNVSTMKLLAANTNKDSGTRHEQYYYQNNKDTTDKGALFLSFSNRLNDIPIQLSPYMDSIKRMKVTYYHIISFGGPTKNQKIVMDTIHGVAKMERIEPPDKKEVMEYVNTYLKSK